MLIKSVFRNFSKRLFQIILLGFIMIMSGFVYVSMDYSIGAIKAPTEKYFKTYQQEHFNVAMLNQLTEQEYLLVDEALFIDVYTLHDVFHHDVETFYQIINHRNQVFKNTFNQVNVEERMHKDLFINREDTQHIIRFLRDNQHINLSYITQGRKPLEIHEIALTEYYAKAHGYHIGDDITFNQSTFKIVGYVLFPDYSLAILGNDFVINNQTRSLALLSDEAFLNLPGQLEVNLSGQFIEQRQPINYFNNNQLPFVMYIALTENTMRSGAIYDELAGGQAMGILMGLVIALMAVFVVAMMVSRMLNEQRGAIGILKALGYKNKEIAFPYLLFILTLSLPGLLIGYMLGFLLSKPLKDLYISIYLLPNMPVTHTLNVFLLSIILPLMILLGLGYVVIMKLLKTHPIELMNPQIQKPKKINKRFKNILNRMSLLKRLKHAYILRNKSRFLVFIMGVFTSVFLILLSLSMVGSFDLMISGYYEKIDVNYIGYCNFSGCPEETTQVDKVLELPYVLLNQTSVLAVGLDADNQFHPLFQNDKDITHKLNEEGIIITKALYMENRYKVGDLVTLSYGGHHIEVRILGIQDEYGSAKIYLNREALSLFLTQGQSTTLHTVVYSKELLTGNYQQVLNLNDIVSQSKDLSQMANIMSIILMMGSIVIGVIVLILISVLALEAYFYDISLFKVIGYNQIEIQKVFMDGYRFYTVLIYVLSIPIAILSFEVMIWYLATQYGMIFPLKLQWYKMVIGFVLTLSIFYLARPIAKKKLSDLSLQQALKIYQN